MAKKQNHKERLKEITDSIKIIAPTPYKIKEQLKSSDQMKWVGLMNAVKAQAKEIIFAELIYN